MEKKKPQNIPYRIAEIRKISHFENSLSDLGLERKEVNNGNVELKLLVLLNEKANQIKFDVEVLFFYEKDNKKFDLFGVRTLHRFEIRKISEVFERNENNKLQIPDGFMITMIKIVIGSTRGILAISNASPDFAHIYLPVINTKVLLDSIKIIEEQ